MCRWSEYQFTYGFPGVHYVKYLSWFTIESNQNKGRFIKFKLIPLNNSYVKNYYDFKKDALNRISNEISNILPFIISYFDNALGK